MSAQHTDVGVWFVVGVGVEHVDLHGREEGECEVAERADRCEQDDTRSHVALQHVLHTAAHSHYIDSILASMEWIMDNVHYFLWVNILCALVPDILDRADLIHLSVDGFCWDEALFA